MSKSINEVRILGRLGSVPEVRYSATNQCIANITVATTEYWTERDSGQKKESTEWHRLVAFNNLAELIRDYVKKGEQHYFSGKLKTRKWQDAAGVDRYTTEIVIEEIILLPQGSGGQASGAAQ